jgi:hypothetical protein
VRVRFHRLHAARVTEQGLHYFRVLAPLEEDRAELVAQGVERNPLLREPRRPEEGFEVKLSVLAGESQSTTFAVWSHLSLREAVRAILVPHQKSGANSPSATKAPVRATPRAHSPRPNGRSESTARR